MPNERSRPHQISLYIHAEYRDEWAAAEEIAERLYGPRSLSRYVSEAVAARNAREQQQ